MTDHDDKDPVAVPTYMPLPSRLNARFGTLGVALGGVATTLAGGDASESVLERALLAHLHADGRLKNADIAVAVAEAVVEVRRMADRTAAGWLAGGLDDDSPPVLILAHCAPWMAAATREVMEYTARQVAVGGTGDAQIGMRLATIKSPASSEVQRQTAIASIFQVVASGVVLMIGLAHYGNRPQADEMFESAAREEGFGVLGAVGTAISRVGQMMLGTPEVWEAWREAEWWRHVGGPTWEETVTAVTLCLDDWMDAGLEAAAANGEAALTELGRLAAAHGTGKAIMTTALAKDDEAGMRTLEDLTMVTRIVGVDRVNEVIEPHLVTRMAALAGMEDVTRARLTPATAGGTEKPGGRTRGLVLNLATADGRMIDPAATAGGDAAGAAMVAGIQDAFAKAREAGLADDVGMVLCEIDRLRAQSAGGPN